MALPAPAVPVGSDPVCGSSSFAFQGTNAHALLQQAGPQSATDAAQARLSVWNRQRVWVAPPVHVLLQKAAATSGTRLARRHTAAAVAIEAELATPQLAFLTQHSVLGLTMFPATAFLEMASGASRQLLNNNDLSGLALRSAVFATPLALRPASTAVHVRCQVQASTGTVEVSSAALLTAHSRTHFYTGFGRKEAGANSRQAGSLVAGQPGPAAPVLLGHRHVAAGAVRLAVALVAVPIEQLGMGIHPAVSEAAMHVAVAHNGQPSVLWVASRMAAALMPLLLAEPCVWASSVAVGRPTAVHSAQQEQQLTSNAGLAMMMAGMETRRLVAQVCDVHQLPGRGRGTPDMRAHT